VRERERQHFHRGPRPRHKPKHWHSGSIRVPRTEYGLTAARRRALEKYLDHMDALILATRRR